MNKQSNFKRYVPKTLGQLSDILPEVCMYFICLEILEFQIEIHRLGKSQNIIT